ncbi:MAG: efflux RND transporter periplasmic adaptor subunit [Maricaulis sp.]|nr:efflux RND transporter periplasmic adaptor subunit [Maricaulis sp.]
MNNCYRESRRWPPVRLSIRLPIAAIVGLFVASCGQALSESTPNLTDTEPPEHRQVERTVPVRQGQLRWEQQVRGQVRVEGAVEIGAEISVKITDVYAEEGDMVHAGQLMASIDPERVQTRLRQARAQHDVALARHEVAILQLEQVRIALHRREELEGRGIISESEMDHLRLELGIRTAQVSLANSEMSISQAQMDAAQIDLERTQIFSPVAGQVTRQNISEGETVNASQISPVLFEITRDGSDISIYAEVPERFVQSVSAGTSVSITAELLRESETSCSITRKYRRPIQRSSFVYYGLLIDCDTAPADLWAGMSVSVGIPMSGGEGVMIVPRGAFLHRPDSAAVQYSPIRPGFESLWALNHNRQWVRRMVQTGNSTDGFVEVLSGDLLLTDRFLAHGSDDR